MENKKNSAGLISQGFWFYEIKQYIELLNEGNSESDIKKLSEENNIFGAVSSSRASEIFNGTRRRVKTLDSSMYELFPKLNIDNQKLVALISVLLLNDLFLEFLLEVFHENMQKGIFELRTTDFRSFFSEKQRTNETVANWKPYTYNRLASAYKSYLFEAGLIREQDGVSIITPKVLDQRIILWLKTKNRLDIFKAITGGL